MLKKVIIRKKYYCKIYDIKYQYKAIIMKNNQIVRILFDIRLNNIIDSCKELLFYLSKEKKSA